MKARILLFTIVLFSVIAAGTCLLLLRKHVTGSSGAAWFEAGCSDRIAANMSCKEVLDSPYSYLPPKHPDRPAGRWHTPAALLGLMYYTGLAIWFIGVGAPSRSRAALHGLITVVVGLGLAGSAYYLWIMFAKLDAWCLYCLITHILNFLIAIGVVLLWPVVMRGPRRTDGGVVESAIASGAAPSANAMPWPQPSGRAFIVTIIAIFGANFGFINAVQGEKLRRDAMASEGKFNLCLGQLNAFKSDPVILLTQWQRAAEKNVPTREGDPVRVYSGDQPEPHWPNVVVFSDFECPSCNRFARFFEAQVVPTFERRITTTFKHYPIDQSCNPRASQTLHPHACEAAKMAEAARIIGGNEAFWRAHDFLFNNQTDLKTGKITVERFASELNLDAARIREVMGSQEVSARIAADIAHAAELEIGGTPAIYVGGKPLVQAVAIEPTFWRALAEHFFPAQPAATGTGASN